MRAAFVLAALALGAWAVGSRAGELGDALHRLHPWTPVLTLVAATVGSAAPVFGWRALVADLGSPLPLPAAARIFFVSQLGKYLPGSLWPFLAATELGRAHDVPRRRTLVASTVVLLLSLLAGVVLGVAMLPLLSDRLRGWWWLLLVGLAVLTALTHPRVVNPVVSTALRAARREPLDRQLSGRAVAVALGWSVVAWLSWGAGVWVLVADLGHGGGTSYLVATGAFCVAWVAGFVVVVAPAGAGVREAVLVATLAPLLPRSGALLVALLMRVALTAADALLAGGAALAARLSGRGLV